MNTPMARLYCVRVCPGEQMSNNILLPTHDLEALAYTALKAAGAPDASARQVAQILLEADLRGVASHGMARLPVYVQRMKAGLINAVAEPEIAYQFGGLAIVDGHNGLGPSAALFATDLAAALINCHGVAWVSVRNSNHFGLASAYTQRLARHGAAAICMSNAAPAMAAYGGKRPVLGTNPISMSVPGAEPPMVLDMATTIVARGKIRNAHKAGEPIPPGVALDRNGRETTDPGAALKGTLAPIGGPKGYGLSVMIDLMCGLFSDGCFATQIGESSDMSRTSGTCFTLIAASTKHLPPDRLAERLSEFRTLMQSSADCEGTVLMPGQIEEGREATSQREGVRVPASLAEELRRLGEGP